MTRHWDHPDGPRRVAQHPLEDEPFDDERFDTTAPGLPGLYCPWTVCQQGCCLRWDGIEKPQREQAWLEWVVQEVLVPGHVAAGALVGERSSGELFALEVDRNEVSRRQLVAPLPGYGQWPCGNGDEELLERVESVRQRVRRFRAGLEAEREVTPKRTRKKTARS